MGYKDNLIRKKDGSYVLKHKTKKHKKGDCPACGENPKDRILGGLYRYKQADMLLVRNHIEEHLTFYSNVKSMTPVLCDECQSLKQYVCVLDEKRKDLKSWKKL